MRGLTEQDVAKLLDVGSSERFKRIDTHVRFVDGTIYDGRPDFDDDSCKLPLSQRRPCVISRAVPNAIKSMGDMVFGEEGFPAVTSAPSEDDKQFEGEDGLDEEESAALDHATRKVVEQVRLRAVAKQILSKAMSGGCVAVLLSIRAGRLRASTIDGKCAEPEFDDEDPCRVRRLVVSYRFVRKEPDPTDGMRMKPHVYQYRRVIDEKSDTTYVPVEVTRETEFPTPSAPEEVVAHGFGYCPVVWYAFERDDAEEASPDGHPVHEGMLTLIDAVNQAKSQRHRAALYCGDPQLVETGVEDDDVRAPMGTVAAAQERANDVAGWSALDGRGRWRGTREVSGRKKGAGVVWRYTSDTAKVAYLALAGDSLKALEDDGKELTTELKEGLRVVDIDPTTLTGAGDISGKTLAFIYTRQVAACNTIREDCWTNCFLPVVGMLFRIALNTRKGLYLPAFTARVRAILERYEREVEGATGKTVWFDPPLRPVWPNYFEATAADEQATVGTVVAAKPFVTAVTALTKLRAIFPDIKDPVAYAEAKAAEALEEQKQQQALALEQMTALHGLKNDAGDDEPGGGGAAKAPPRAGGGARPAPPRRGGAPNAKGGARPPAKAG